jgi:hypothetical protein
MLVVVLIELALSSPDLYFASTAPFGSSCTEAPGCSLGDPSASLSAGSHVHVYDSSLDPNQTLSFLAVINNSLSMNLSVVGGPTSLNVDLISPSDDPILNAENVSLRLSELSFRFCHRPLLNAFQSSCALLNINISHCRVAAAQLLAFVESRIEMGSASLFETSAFNQSFAVCFRSSVNISSLSFRSNALTAGTLAPGWHFLESQILIENSAFSSNSMNMPIIDASNGSDVSVVNCSFTNNSVVGVGVFEYSSKVRFESVSFDDNMGFVIYSADMCIVDFSKSSIRRSFSPGFLFELAESSLSVKDCSVTNSTMNRLISIQTGLLEIMNSSFRELNTENPLFDTLRVNMTMKECFISQLTSQGGLAVLGHSLGLLTIHNCNLTRITCKPDTSSLIFVKQSFLKLSSVIFRENMASATIIEKCKASLRRCEFFPNQCFPGDSSLPLAIVSISECEPDELHVSAEQGNPRQPLHP